MYPWKETCPGDVITSAQDKMIQYPDYGPYYNDTNLIQLL